MLDWTLKIEVDGQWESCRYSTQFLAQNAYESVLKDYGRRISQAQLISKDGVIRLLKIISKPLNAVPDAAAESLVSAAAIAYQV